MIVGRPCKQQLVLCMYVCMCVQAERRRAAEVAAETEAAARAEASRLVLEKQLQQEADLQQAPTPPLKNVHVFMLLCVACRALACCCCRSALASSIPS